MRAWQFNPASFITYLFVAVQLPWQVVQMCLLWQRKRAIESLWIFALPIAMAGAMMVQWVFRIAI